MKYRSKKDPSIEAAFDFKDEKTKTIRMIYLSGDKAGHSFEVSNSTLKRWWKPIKADESEVEAEIINTPYHPDVKPHYIPKPDAVKRYEDNKKAKHTNTELPDFESFVEEFKEFIAKVNDSNYVMLKDSGTTIWRKSLCIDIYADEPMWKKFVAQGLQSKPNKDKCRPFAIKIKTAEEYELMRNAIMN